MASVTHFSARLTWHNEGWNGHICKEPKKNIHCTGQYSYPGEMYNKKEEVLKEQKEFAGCNCAAIKAKHIPPCCFSINAFGKESIEAYTTSPEWYENFEVKKWEMPPNTISVWPYEEMYYDEDKNENGTFNYEKRISNVKNFIDTLEKDRSLIFYYSNYSNPFSEDENKRYVIAGISRLKYLPDEFMKYEKATPQERERYAGAFVWQLPITSHYPEQGFRIPYHLYKDKPDILEKIALFPENERCFKYGMRQMTDDDALEVVERALEVVDVLQHEIGDTSEDWDNRRKWLQSLIGELWTNRGKYPGLPKVLNYLGVSELNKWFKTQTKNGKEEEAYQAINNSLLKNIPITGVEIKKQEWNELQDWLAGCEEDELELLLKILPRFDLQKEQIEKILESDREKNSIHASVKEIIENPYILSESYIGDNLDDKITFSKIDHGMMPSPDLGLEGLTTAGSAIRFRTLCVNELKKVSAHTFTASEIVLNNLNRYLSLMREWRQYEFKKRNFDSYEEELNKVIVKRKDADGNLHLYLKSIFDDERFIEAKIREMNKRKITSFKSPVTEKNWHSFLYDSSSELAKLNPSEYDKAVQGQIEVCQKIFTQGLSVICGGAGTGKTTIVRSIIDAIEKAHGAGTSFLLLAPTGKAADRLRERTKKEAQTIHSFLAKRNWLNDNYTFRHEGGKQEEDVKIFIIDECSMLDQSLIATLFKAINWNTVQRIILVGDPNQLPAIGVGKVFADIINWLDDEHKGILHVNLRQMENRLTGKGTGILDLASIFIHNKDIIDSKEEIKEIAEKKALEVDLLKQIQELDFSGNLKDLNVIFWDNEEQLKELMFNTLVNDLENEHDAKYDETRYYELLNKAFEDKENSNKKRADLFQVISPYRGELFGTDVLNTFLQSKFNRQRFELKQFMDGISLFDKVIQVRNRTKSDPIYAYKDGINQPVQIFNGELGFTKAHPFDNKKYKDEETGRWYNYRWMAEKFRPIRFTVNFEGRTEIISFGKELGKFQHKNKKWYNLPEEKPLGNLELAYAISVHKSQGSEFTNVYLVLPKNKKALLSKELIYTAITRAKTKLTIFAEKDISAFLQLTRPEASSLSKINSSLFDFKPLPKEWLVINEWYQEGKIHETLSSYMVRSKSEVIIANMLFERKIPFKYEYPLFAEGDGSFYLPDFTITINGEDYYLEHIGRLDDPKYKAHWEKKEKWYKKHYLGKLLTTLESGKLSTDINKIIDDLISQ